MCVHSGPRIIAERLDPYPDEIFQKSTFRPGANPDGKWSKFENSQSRHPDDIDDRLIKPQALVQTKSAWCSGCCARQLVGVDDHCWECNFFNALFLFQKSDYCIFI